MLHLHISKGRHKVGNPPERMVMLKPCGPEWKTVFTAANQGRTCMEALVPSPPVEIDGLEGRVRK